MDVLLETRPSVHGKLRDRGVEINLIRETRLRMAEVTVCEIPQQPKVETRKRKVVNVPPDFDTHKLYITPIDELKLQESNNDPMASAELMKRIVDRHHMYAREKKRQNVDSDVRSGKRPPPMQHKTYLQRFMEYLEHSGSEEVLRFKGELMVRMGEFTKTEEEQAAAAIETATIPFGKFFGKRWVDVWNDTLSQGKGRFNECGAAYLDWLYKQKETYNDCQAILNYLATTYPREPVMKFLKQDL